MSPIIREKEKINQAPQSSALQIRNCSASSEQNGVEDLYVALCYKQRRGS